MADDITDWQEDGAADTPPVAPPTPPPAPLGTASPAPAAADVVAEAASDAASLEDHETDNDARDERDNKGRFKRARSQRAGPADVPRIKELTRRLRETEAERDALRGAAPTAPASPRAPEPPQAAPTPPPARAVAASALPPVKAAKDDPEPDAAAYDGSAGKDFHAYIRDHSRWAAREELRDAHAAQERVTAEQRVKDETTRIQTDWRGKVAEAKTLYPDFEAVAFAPVQGLPGVAEIPEGSVIDALIWEHKSGAKLLYHLKKHPAELGALLALPMWDQVEALSLLTQRLSTPPRVSAVVTGAAAAPVAKLVPRPPTPVRTGPLRTGSDLPGDDDSLEAHEKAFHPPRRRRA